MWVSHVEYGRIKRQDGINLKMREKKNINNEVNELWKYFSCTRKCGEADEAIHEVRTDTAEYGTLIHYVLTRVGCHRTNEHHLLYTCTGKTSISKQ